MSRLLPLVCLAAVSPILLAAPQVNLDLPERCRLLTRQYFDLRVEARGLTDTSATLVLRDELGNDIGSQFGTADEATTDNDSLPGDIDKAWVFRARSFPVEGVKTIVAEVHDASGTGSDTRKIGVQRFKARPGNKKNIILFIGDAMGESYRDAGRIVSRSTGGRFRGGFFDQLLEMDRMPYLGMVLTHSHNALVPDSANTASAWSSGNKTVNGALNVFPDNNDWRGTSEALLDNPRFETLWSYLRRLHGYKTGIVTTVQVTDATPAAEGSYTISRGQWQDIARQFVDGTFNSGPAFDVILGGGKTQFDARADNRNLIQELVSLGYVHVADRSGLNALAQPPDKLIGLFHSDAMTVAYDKLGYLRPADESSTATPTFPDQPFLEEMTAKAIASLSKNDSPFILMVEGGSVDKQSHGNQAAGTIWDVIELDRAIGVSRAFAKANPKRPTLVLATADHNQSMQVLGVVDGDAPGATENVRAESGYAGLTGGASGFPDYETDSTTGYPRNDNRYRMAVGFRTHDHTASPVPISAEGPGASLFTGIWDQTDLFFKMARVLDSDTTKLDRLEKERQRLQIVDQNYDRE
ncbi:alkaline phosphatase [Luteolibacter soli]|uniref:Alkaline phosphatase n=1 Tax=Luteolibacter soli TaxID=3135280 RepID=A0ABU9AXH7_9BACT